jgi:hypothetical protein
MYIVLGIIVISGTVTHAHFNEKIDSTLSSTDFDMVIIAPELFSTSLQPLIKHKNSVGIKTTLKTVESIYDEYEGRDYAEQIKYFIKDAIETYGISYVLLVGGKGIFPIRETKAYSEALAHSFIFHTDLYYADIYDAQGRFCSWNANNNTIFGEMNETENKDGIDGFPDVCVGRFLSRSVSDLEVVVQKSITYETQTFGSPWFHYAIAIGGDTHVDPFYEFFEPLVLGIKGRMAFEGDFIGDTAQKYLDDFEFVKLYGNFLRRDAEKISKKSISAAINNGAGFLLINTHGLTDKIFTHPPLCPKRWIPTPDGYTIGDVKDLTNGNKLPIGVFCCCLTGHMDNIRYPFAWEFIQNDKGGGVACFALSESGELASGTLSTMVLTGHLSIGVIKAYSQGSDIIGDIWKDAIENYLNDDFAMSYGDGSLSEKLISYMGIINNYGTIQNWILFGDPSLKIGGYP